MVFNQALELTENAGKVDVFVNVAAVVFPGRPRPFATASHAPDSHEPRASGHAESGWLPYPRFTPERA